MSDRFPAWPRHAHPVLAVMLAIALIFGPILLPSAELRNVPAALFAYAMACLLGYPFPALLRRRVTSLPLLCALAALAILALCFFHTNIIHETAELSWAQKRDITLDKFLFNLPQTIAGTLGWWILVVLPDRRQTHHQTTSTSSE
jgi:hypothetical protein